MNEDETKQCDECGQDLPEEATREPFLGGGTPGAVLIDPDNLPLVTFETNARFRIHEFTYTADLDIMQPCGPQPFYVTPYEAVRGESKRHEGFLELEICSEDLEKWQRSVVSSVDWWHTTEDLKTPRRRMIYLHEPRSNERIILSVTFHSITPSIGQLGLVVHAVNSSNDEPKRKRKPRDYTRKAKRGRRRKP